MIMMEAIAKERKPRAGSGSGGGTPAPVPAVNNMINERGSSSPTRPAAPGGSLCSSSASRRKNEKRSCTRRALTSACSGSGWHFPYVMSTYSCCWWSCLCLVYSATAAAAARPLEQDAAVGPVLARGAEQAVEEQKTVEHELDAPAVVAVDEDQEEESPQEVHMIDCCAVMAGQSEETSQSWVRDATPESAETEPDQESQPGEPDSGIPASDRGQSERVLLDEQVDQAQLEDMLTRRKRIPGGDQHVEQRSESRPPSTSPALHLLEDHETAISCATPPPREAPPRGSSGTETSFNDQAQDTGRRVCAAAGESGCCGNRSCKTSGIQEGSASGTGLPPPGRPAQHRHQEERRSSSCGSTRATLALALRNDMGNRRGDHAHTSALLDTEEEARDRADHLHRASRVRADGAEDAEQRCWTRDEERGRGLSFLFARCCSVSRSAGTRAGGNEQLRSSPPAAGTPDAERVANNNYAYADLTPTFPCPYASPATSSSCYHQLLDRVGRSFSSCSTTLEAMPDLWREGDDHSHSRSRSSRSSELPPSGQEHRGHDVDEPPANVSLLCPNAEARRTVTPAPRLLSKDAGPGARAAVSEAAGTIPRQAFRAVVPAPAFLATDESSRTITTTTALATTVPNPDVIQSTSDRPGRRHEPRHQEVPLWHPGDDATESLLAEQFLRFPRSKGPQLRANAGAPVAGGGRAVRTYGDGPPAGRGAAVDVRLRPPSGETGDSHFSQQSVVRGRIGVQSQFRMDENGADFHAQELQRPPTPHQQEVGARVVAATTASGCAAAGIFTRVEQTPRTPRRRSCEQSPTPEHGCRRWASNQNHRIEEEKNAIMNHVVVGSPRFLSPPASAEIPLCRFVIPRRCTEEGSGNPAVPDFVGAEASYSSTTHLSRSSPATSLTAKQAQEQMQQHDDTANTAQPQEGRTVVPAAPAGVGGQRNSTPAARPEDPDDEPSAGMPTTPAQLLLGSAAPSPRSQGASTDAVPSPVPVMGRGTPGRQRQREHERAPQEREQGEVEGVAQEMTANAEPHPAQLQPVAVPLSDSKPTFMSTTPRLLPGLRTLIPAGSSCSGSSAGSAGNSTASSGEDECPERPAALDSHMRALGFWNVEAWEKRWTANIDRQKKGKRILLGGGLWRSFGGAGRIPPQNGANAAGGSGSSCTSACASATFSTTGAYISPPGASSRGHRDRGFGLAGADGQLLSGAHYQPDARLPRIPECVREGSPSENPETPENPEADVEGIVMSEDEVENEKETSERDGDGAAESETGYHAAGRGARLHANDPRPDSDSFWNDPVHNQAGRAPFISGCAGGDGREGPSSSSAAFDGDEHAHVAVPPVGLGVAGEVNVGASLSQSTRTELITTTDQHPIHQQSVSTGNLESHQKTQSARISSAGSLPIPPLAADVSAAAAPLERADIIEEGEDEERGMNKHDRRSESDSNARGQHKKLEEQDLAQLDPEEKAALQAALMDIDMVMEQAPFVQQERDEEGGHSVVVVPPPPPPDEGGNEVGTPAAVSTTTILPRGPPQHEDQPQQRDEVLVQQGTGTATGIAAATAASMPSSSIVAATPLHQPVSAAREQFSGGVLKSGHLPLRNPRDLQRADWHVDHNLRNYLTLADLNNQPPEAPQNLVPLGGAGPRGSSDPHDLYLDPAYNGSRRTAVAAGYRGRGTPTPGGLLVSDPVDDTEEIHRILLEQRLLAGACSQELLMASIPGGLLASSPAVVAMKGTARKTARNRKKPSPQYQLERDHRRAMQQRRKAQHDLIRYRSASLHERVASPRAMMLEAALPGRDQDGRGSCPPRLRAAGGPGDDRDGGGTRPTQGGAARSQELVHQSTDMMNEGQRERVEQAGEDPAGQGTPPPRVNNRGWLAKLNRGRNSSPPNAGAAPAGTTGAAPGQPRQAAPLPTQTAHHEAKAVDTQQQTTTPPARASPSDLRATPAASSAPPPKNTETPPPPAPADLDRGTPTTPTIRSPRLHLLAPPGGGPSHDLEMFRTRQEYLLEKLNLLGRPAPINPQDTASEEGARPRGEEPPPQARGGGGLLDDQGGPRERAGCAQDSREVQEVEYEFLDDHEDEEPVKTTSPGGRGPVSSRTGGPRPGPRSNGKASLGWDDKSREGDVESMLEAGTRTSWSWKGGSGEDCGGAAGVNYNSTPTHHQRPSRSPYPAPGVATPGGDAAGGGADEGPDPEGPAAHQEYVGQDVDFQEQDLQSPRLSACTSVDSGPEDHDDTGATNSMATAATGTSAFDRGQGASTAASSTVDGTLTVTNTYSEPQDSSKSGTTCSTGGTSGVNRVGVQRVIIRALSEQTVLVSSPRVGQVEEVVSFSDNENEEGGEGLSIGYPASARCEEETKEREFREYFRDHAGPQPKKPDHHLPLDGGRSGAAGGGVGSEIDVSLGMYVRSLRESHDQEQEQMLMQRQTSSETTCSCLCANCAATRKQKQLHRGLERQNPGQLEGGRQRLRKVTRKTASVRLRECSIAETIREMLRMRDWHGEPDVEEGAGKQKEEMRDGDDDHEDPKSEINHDADYLCPVCNCRCTRGDQDLHRGPVDMEVCPSCFHFEEEGSGGSSGGGSFSLGGAGPAALFFLTTEEVCSINHPTDLPHEDGHNGEQEASHNVVDPDQDLTGTVKATSGEPIDGSEAGGRFFAPQCGEGGGAGEDDLVNGPLVQVGENGEPTANSSFMNYLRRRPATFGRYDAPDVLSLETMTAAEWRAAKVHDKSLIHRATNEQTVIRQVKDSKLIIFHRAPKRAVSTPPAAPSAAAGTNHTVDEAYGAAEV